MRFMSRAIGGLALAFVTLGLIAIGGWRLYSAFTTPDDSDRKVPEERSYVVDTRTLDARTVKPVLIAFGQVRAWTMLDLRAATTGPLTTLSPNFRDGMLVSPSEVLFTIDPEIAERRVVDAQAALAQAQSSLAEAKASVAHLRSELASSQAQLLVQKRDLERKQQLRTKQITTEAVVDQAILTVSAGEQAVIAKEQGLTAGLARIEQGQAAVKRAELTLKDSQRALKDSTMRAPFGGRLTDVSVTLGRRVAQNEKLGALIDLRSLEVSFPVRNSDYARLVDPGDASQLIKLPVRVKLSLGDRVATIDGVLDRSAAVVSSTQAGRMVFARLVNPEKSPLRPGDFVTIEIDEPELEGVAVVPAQAATADGEILTVGPDNRLQGVRGRVLRHQGDELIIDQVPFGRKYIRTRMPFLAPGVLVKPREEQEPTNAVAQPAQSEDAIVKLSEARRKELIELVEQSTKLTPARKREFLDLLSRNEATVQVIERIEQHGRINGGPRQRS